MRRGGNSWAILNATRQPQRCIGCMLHTCTEPKPSPHTSTATTHCPPSGVPKTQHAIIECRPGQRQAHPVELLDCHWKPCPPGVTHVETSAPSLPNAKVLTRLNFLTATGDSRNQAAYTAPSAPAGKRQQGSSGGEGEAAGRATPSAPAGDRAFRRSSSSGRDRAAHRGQPHGATASHTAHRRAPRAALEWAPAGGT